MECTFDMAPVQFLAAAHLVVLALSAVFLGVWVIGDWWLGRRS